MEIYKNKGASMAAMSCRFNTAANYTNSSFMNGMQVSISP